MSIEILRSIKETELEAEELRKKSVIDARKVVSLARGQAFKLVEQAMEDAEKEAKRLINEAERDIQDQVVKRMKEVEDECSFIQGQAGSKLNLAVDSIWGRIVNTHGNR